MKIRVYLDNCAYNRPFDDMEQMIKSENALRMAGMKLLIEGLGAVNAERFIHCIKTDSFDYTEWQRDLWKDKTIDEIHASATAFYAERHG